MNKRIPTDRFPKDSDDHTRRYSLMQRMNYYLKTFEKRFNRIPTFEDIYQKSLELLPDVKHFKSEYIIMLEVYVECRRSDVGIYRLADELQRKMFPDVEVKFCLVSDLDVGYIDIQDEHYEIHTPFSWFTLLHEFIHIMLTEAEFNDDEQMGYVIPSGVYYFYKYYGDRINDGFIQTRL